MSEPLRCPIGTCQWCDALRRQEQDARCPNRPAVSVTRDSITVAFTIRALLLFVLAMLVVAWWFA